MACKLEPVIKRMENDGTPQETVDIAKKYAEIKRTEAMDGLLTPEEQDFIQQVQEVSALSNVATELMSKPMYMKSSLVSDANVLKPKWKGRRATVVAFTETYDGVQKAVIHVNGKYYTVDPTSLETQTSSVADILKYGAEPETTQGNFIKKLESGKVTSMKEMLALFDEMVAIDGDKISSTHAKVLRGVLSKIVGSVVRALPEMAIYVDSQAVKNGGAFTLKTQGESKLTLSINSTGSVSNNEKSMTEIFVHEMVHAATAYALSRMKESMPYEIIRLRKIRDAVMKKLTVDDLMPEVSVDPVADRALAEQRYDYINGSLTEFLAYVTTNEKVMEAANNVKVYETAKPAKVVDQIVYYLKKLIDAALMKWRNEDRTTSADQAAQTLLTKIMEIQAEGMNRTKEDGMIEKAFDKMDDYVAGLMDKAAKKMERDMLFVPKPTGSIAKKAKWYLEGVYQLLTNGKNNGVLETVLSAVGAKPEGTIQTILSHVKEGDNLSEIATQMTLLAVQIDSNRETTALTIAGMVNSMFKKPLKAAGRKVLQAGILVNDAAAILEKYVDSGIFEDDVKMKAKIEELTKELEALSTERHMRLYEMQMDGLVKLMLEGKSSEIQLNNAIAIARRLGSADEASQHDERVAELIDELVSMKAWVATGEEVKTKTRELLSEEKEAVVAFAKLQKGMHKYLLDTYTDGRRINEKKGYIRETYDERVSSIIAPAADVKEMRDRGYKLVKKVKMADALATGQEMALYVASNMVKQPINKTAIRVTGAKQAGLTVFEMLMRAGDEMASTHAKSAIAYQKKVTALKMELVMQGKAVDLEGILSPEFDANGRIVDYRHTVTMTDKIQHLGLEMDGPESIGRGFAHQVDEEQSEMQNEVIWEELLVDLAKNKGKSNINRDFKEYIAIDINSDVKIVQDVARILPPTFKAKLSKLRSEVRKAPNEPMVSEATAQTMYGKAWDRLDEKEKLNARAQLQSGKLWVRRDMLLPMFGVRDMSMVDLPGLKHLPAAMKRWIRFLENYWKSFVSMYKVDVVIKTLPVIMLNVMSNVVSGMLAGENPIEIVKNYIAAWTELDNYIKMKERVAELNAELALGDRSSDSIRRELEKLVNDMKESPIAPLVTAGLYTQIVEETEAANYTSSNRIARALDDKLDMLPTMVRKGVDLLWVREKTALFQLVHAATAKSDFVARYSQFAYAKKKEVAKKEKELKRKLKEDEIKEIERKIIKVVRTAYVNYAAPDSPALQYANDMGLLLFTRYAIRVQAALHQLAMGHPVRMAVALIGQEVMAGGIGWEPEDVTEKSFMTHGLDIFYTPDVQQMIENVVIPQMYTNVKEAIKAF